MFSSRALASNELLGGVCTTFRDSWWSVTRLWLSFSLSYALVEYLSLSERKEPSRKDGCAKERLLPRGIYTTRSSGRRLAPSCLEQPDVELKFLISYVSAEF